MASSLRINCRRAKDFVATTNVCPHDKILAVAAKARFSAYKHADSMSDSFQQDKERCERFLLI